MKQNYFLLFHILFLLKLSPISASAQAPDTLWTSLFDGPGDEIGRCVQQTTDGGYIIVGSTESYGAGSFDVWLIKTDEDGNEEWSRTFGGSNYDYGYYVKQTLDSGYILIGDTYSFSSGANDIWLIKTDEHGEEQWNNTFGGIHYEWGYCVQPTSDGGYILTGVFSNISADSSDLILIKTDENGEEEWTRYFGGNSFDAGVYVIENDEGDYIATGYTSTSASECNVWLIKVNATGESLWSRSYGGTGRDEGRCVQQTEDGGYAIAGGTMSFGGSDKDAWLIKTDENGDSLWSQVYGGSNEDYAYIVRVEEAGGYFLAGYTISYSAGNRDVWLLRTNDVGDLLWTKSIGGSGFETAYGAQGDENGGWIITGYQTDAGMTDYALWLLRIEYSLKITLQPQISPVIIPITGGSFQYNIRVANNLSTTENFDVWINVVLPGGGQITVVGPVEISMASGGNGDRWRTQMVPANAPGGEYQMKGYVGDYPATVVHSDSFPITKEGTSVKWTGDEGWISAQDFFPLFDGDKWLIPSDVSTCNADPNPFNPTTAISYQLPAASFVNLAVYDVSGRKVAELVNGWRDAGVHGVTFDGSHLASGVYIYRLVASGSGAIPTIKSGKMVLIR